jgi:REP element-mobilizing transposase RayT
VGTIRDEMEAKLQSHRAAPVRRSVRQPAFDYAQPGAYFFTIVTRDRVALFGTIEDERMIANPLGEVVMDEWQRTTLLRPEIELDAFVVMPNHVHGIIWIRDRASMDAQGSTRSFGKIEPHSLSSIVRGFKAACTKRANQIRGTASMPLWQRNYYEHVIRNERELANIRRYVVENPLRWAIDHENPQRR